MRFLCVDLDNDPDGEEPFEAEASSADSAAEYAADRLEAYDWPARIRVSPVDGSAAPRVLKVRCELVRVFHVTEERE